MKKTKKRGRAPGVDSLPTTELGWHLYRLRGKRSLVSVAKQAGVGASSWCLREHGERIPRPAIIRAIAGAFGLPVNGLLKMAEARKLDRAANVGQVRE